MYLQWDPCNVPLVRGSDMRFTTTTYPRRVIVPCLLSSPSLSPLPSLYLSLPLSSVLSSHFPAASVIGARIGLSCTEFVGVNEVEA